MPKPIPAIITVEPPQEGERRVIVRRPGQVGLVEIGYMRPNSLHPDFIPLDLLATIGVASPVLLTPLGLALWCGSTLVP